MILTGTPIQNDLSEYFALLNFANPNYLGDRAQFRKTYELPILRGRDSDSSESEVALAEAKLKELTAKVQKFIIRRTNDLLSKYCGFLSFFFHFQFTLLTCSLDRVYFIFSTGKI